MSEKPQAFYAKILLFGEYSVITGSMALTIPYGHFSGELSFIHEDKYTNYDFARWSNLQLRSLFDYISNTRQHHDTELKLDMQRFRDDIDNGLYFESTIPQGYGIGSSGALVAAVYHRYANPRISFHPGMEQETLALLKRQFALVESFYHGTSSGIDPLNSYARYPLLIRNMKDIEAVSIPRGKQFIHGAIFLLDTGRPGKTEPLVNIFMNSIESMDAESIDEGELNEITNAAIKSLVSDQPNVFFDRLRDLSEYQYEHFDPMIPAGYKELWRQGLDSDDFYLKLCGSGGGGFLLGFTPDYNRLKVIFSEMQFKSIPVYKNKG